jgi:hypothetical protein
LASDLEEEYEEYGLHLMFRNLHFEEDDHLEKGEYEEDGFFPMLDSLYHDEDDQLKDEEFMDDIADYEEDGENLLGEVPNFNGEQVDYVDFLGIEDILNSPNNDYSEFYTNEENYIFTRKTMADPFLSIFMAREREKERGKNDKSKVFPRDVWGFPYDHQGNPMMRSVMLILGCYIFSYFIA